ncbi:AAA family ATPase [Henriciella aquimarina]|uniref:AAA family ATPase n=1 Tax=Henriciella aquimarina TaxID=545261 RepID=UPI0009FDA939|nr:AAA family ATPase [Henriciella aquimarina]
MSDTPAQRPAGGRQRLHVFAPQWGRSVSEAAREAGLAVTVQSEAAVAVEAAIAEPGAIVIIENDGSFDLVELLIRVGRDAPNLPGIVIGENVPVLAVKHLLSMARWDMLDTPIGTEPLQQSVAQVSRRDTSGADETGKCWTVTGSVGGAGATLVAVEIAYQISQREHKNRVCLVDLDFFDGACASYLNCPSNLNQQALTQSADRIDEALLQAFITRHKNGIHLLSAPRSDRLWNTIKPEAILKVLDIACASYDHVVIDLPRWPSPWTAAVVTGSDENIVMSELTVPALHAARNRAEEIEDLSEGLASPRIVLNRMAKKVFGNTVTVAQAEEAIGRPVFGTISSDWDAALSAVNFGQAVSQAKPGNRITKDVGLLIETLERGGNATSQIIKARKSA